MDIFKLRERRLRAYPPVTLTELSAAAGVAIGTISKLETQNNPNPTHRVITAIERALVELLAENLVEDHPHPFDAKPHLATNM